MELEGMHTNVDVYWERKEREFSAANNALDISVR